MLEIFPSCDTFNFFLQCLNIFIIQIFHSFGYIYGKKILRLLWIGLFLWFLFGMFILYINDYWILYRNFASCYFSEIIFCRKFLVELLVSLVYRIISSINKDWLLPFLLVSLLSQFMSYCPAKEFKCCNKWEWKEWQSVSFFQFWWNASSFSPVSTMLAAGLLYIDLIILICTMKYVLNMCYICLWCETFV